MSPIWPLRTFALIWAHARRGLPVFSDPPRWILAAELAQLERDTLNGHVKPGSLTATRWRTGSCRRAAPPSMTISP
jgi:hypothetical protein